MTRVAPRLSTVLCLVATVGWSQPPAQGEQVLAQLYQDATVLPEARRGPDWASVSTSTASPTQLVVRAQSRGMVCRATLLVAHAPRRGSVFIRDLFFGPGWVRVEVEDADAVHQHFYFESKGELRHVLDVLVSDHSTARATVEWRPSMRELEVTTQWRSLPPFEGCLPPELHHVVYRWDAPGLVELSRDSVGPGSGCK